ncbi:MAG: lipocalin family protein [Bdellovibrionales bacterium]|nr:lipocalin family protein [Bdellovibrionales bacterium]
MDTGPRREEFRKSIFAVVVGSPRLDFGWILSRTPVLTESSIEKALSAAESVGYDRELFKSFQR